MNQDAPKIRDLFEKYAGVCSDKPCLDYEEFVAALAELQRGGEQPGVLSQEDLMRACAANTELEHRVSALTEERDRYLEWANCGGVPIGRKCKNEKEPDHEIYGAHVGNGDGTFTCEFHHLTKEIETMRRSLQSMREALDVVLKRGNDSLWIENGERKSMFAVVRAALSAPEGKS